MSPVVGLSPRLIFHRLREGSDILEEIKRVAESHDVRAATFNMIGGVDRLVVGVYRGGGQYEKRVFEEFMEVVSCTGTISRRLNGEVAVHAHIAAGNWSKVVVGHLMPGSRVKGTGELVIVEAERAELVRAPDPETGLELLQTDPAVLEVEG